MNDWDRNNLNFILSSTNDAFAIWMDQASTDDLAYAMQLISQYRINLLYNKHASLDDITDFTEANIFINRVKEKL